MVMYLVVKNGYIDVIKFLFEYNVNVNVFDWEFWILFMLVVWGGNLEVICLFIDNGVDVDVCDEDSCNVLEYVVKENYVNVV